MKHPRLLAGAVSAVALVSLAACGSDSESSDTTKAAVTTTVEAVTTTVRSATTLPGGVTLPPGVTIPELSGNCKELADGMPDIADPAELADTDVDAYFSELDAAVPSDLKDDVATLRSALTPLAEILRDSGGDITKAIQDPKVQDAMASMSSGDLAPSAQAISGWLQAGCPSS